MASSTTASAPTATPATAVASTTLPVFSSQALPSATSEGFLKPGSPRKRRRSPEGLLPPDKTLEAQIKTKLDLTSPVELTGASEMAEKMADKKRKLGHTSETSSSVAAMGKLQSANPLQQAISALSGANAKAMSRPTDAPQSQVASNDLSRVGSIQVSPVSNASFNTTASVSVNPPQVASPTEMGDNDMPDDKGTVSGSVATTLSTQTPSSKAYSYPDPSFSTLRPPQPAHRDMSLPGASTSDDTKLPASGKKHKCPYCDTEFTRHHNLKSHLLTHSQEKPYLCQQCDMRFRRLHDLKRHAKLHTGERPHVCPICNRKFARGDALARHTKGSGGCAGHRSSVSSNFAGEMATDGEMVMEGMICGETPSQEPGEMDESEGPSRQLTQSKIAQFPGVGQNSQSRPSSTYPPVASGRFQPSGDYGSGNLSPAGPHTNASYGQSAGGQNSFPPANSNHSNSSNNNNFGPGGMSESPVPISPSAAHHSGTHDSQRGSVVQQQLHPYSQANRQGYTSPRGGNSGSAPTATMGGLPPPQSVPPNVSAPGSGGHFGTLLPPISTDRGGGLGSHAPGHGTNGPPYQSAPGSASTHNSLSSHGQSSGERNALGIDERDRLWALVSTLQAEMKDMRNRHDILVREVEVLRRAQKEE